MSTNRQDIYLIRHAETTAEADQVIGQTDVELSSVGKQNIANLIKSWKQDPPAKVYCSGLIRSQQSAEILNKNWQLEIEQDDQLNELNFGLWENKSWDKAYSSDPEFFNYWAENWHTEAAPMGESFEDLANRCRDWLSNVSTDDSPIVIVAHAGTLRAITSILLDLPAISIFNFEFSHACVTKFEVSDESSRLIYLNNFNFS